jgi:hypothetical protein
MCQSFLAGIVNGVTATSSTSKTIICLANSRKLAGRCVAGIELQGNRPIGWIRPVSDRPHREVSEFERRYEEGTDPRVLDVVEVPLLMQCPDAYQSENWLLDPGAYWVKRGSVDSRDLDSLIDTGPLWLEEESSTFHGLYDRVGIEVAAGLNDSLRLIGVEDLELRVFAPGRDFGDPKRRVQACFTHEGVPYRLRVTDPVIERAYLPGGDAAYAVGPAFLTISLGEPYNGHVYKLVAAIILP